MSKFDEQYLVQATMASLDVPWSGQGSPTGSWCGPIAVRTNGGDRWGTGVLLDMYEGGKHDATWVVYVDGEVEVEVPTEFIYFNTARRECRDQLAHVCGAGVRGDHGAQNAKGYPYNIELLPRRRVSEVARTDPMMARMARDIEQGYPDGLLPQRIWMGKWYIARPHKRGWGAVVPGLAELDAKDQELLAGGSRRVDALAVAVVARHVLHGATP